jgi:SET domain-containing protein
MDKKNKIVERIKNTYCRLKPSTIHGTGVFAIREIPKGINPFLSEPKQKWIKINKKAFDGMDEEIIKLIEDFFWFDKKGNGWVTEEGISGMGMSFYPNHSKQPNLKRADDDGNFVSLRIIKKGEELLVDYETYDEE